MSDYDYKSAGAPKLTDEFKQKFIVNIKGKDAIKVEGLVAVANDKGIKSMTTNIIQFPSDANKWTCICQTTVVGYGWDPVNEKICEVVFSDIADANELNCTSMVKQSFIRMASTRSIGRALRKYTNIDMVCSSELSDVTEEAPVEMITTDTLTQVKALIGVKKISKDQFKSLLETTFNGNTNYVGYTAAQGNTLLNVLNSIPTPPTE